MTIKILDYYFNYDNIAQIHFRHNDAIKGIMDGESVVHIFDQNGTHTCIELDSVTAHRAEKKLEVAVINDYILVDLTEE